jgi:hypothetical protein
VPQPARYIITVYPTQILSVAVLSTWCMADSTSQHTTSAVAPSGQAFVLKGTLRVRGHRHNFMHNNNSLQHALLQ